MKGIKVAKGTNMWFVEGEDISDKRLKGLTYGFIYDIGMGTYCILYDNPEHSLISWCEGGGGNGHIISLLL